MKKQRTILIAMLLALLFSLTACGGQTIPPRGTAEALPDSAESLAEAIAETVDDPTEQSRPEPEPPAGEPAEQPGPAAEAASANGSSAAQGAGSGFSQPVISIMPRQDTQAGGGVSSESSGKEKGDVYEAVRLINLERKKMGLKDLEINDTLMEAAAVRAKEQVRSFGHTRPDGSRYYTIFDEVGYDGGYGVENAGMGTNARLYAYEQVNGWMNSPGHKANILSPNEDEIGVGYYSVGANSYWIMITGRITGNRTSSGSGSSGNGSAQEKGDVYEAIRLINLERTKVGLNELKIDDSLMKATAVRAKEIAELYDHVRPDGTKFYTVIDNYQSCAENIYKSPKTAQAAVEGWMNSPGHKANILREGVDYIGVGYYHDGNMPNWVMIVAKWANLPAKAEPKEPADDLPAVDDDPETEEPEEEPEPEPVGGGDTDEWIRLVNAARAKNGKGPVTVIGELMNLADERAEEMLHATDVEIYGAGIAGEGIKPLRPYDHRGSDTVLATIGEVHYSRIDATAQDIVDYDLRYNASSPLYTEDEIYVGVGYYEKDGAFLWIMVEIWFD